MDAHRNGRRVSKIYIAIFLLVSVILSAVVFLAWFKYGVWQSWVALSIGMLLAGLTAGFLTICRRYTEGLLAANEQLLGEINEHRRAEEHWRENEEKYRRLAELSPDTIYIQGEGKIAYINAAGVRLFGADNPEQLLGKKVLELIHPDDREIERERIQCLKDHGTVPPLVKEKYLRLDGMYVYVEVAAIPFLYHDQPAAQVIARDITALKQAEGALFESEGKLSSIINTIPFPIFSKDSNLRYNECNTAFCDFLGLKKEDLIGKSVYEVAPKENADVYQKADLDLLNSGSSQNYETVVRHRDGTDHDVIFHKGVYFDGRGNRAGLVGIYVDITERKRAEKEMSALQTQLRHAQKMEAIGTLAGGVAHDFNNILNVIIGFGGLIQMKMKADDPSMHYLKEILAAGERATYLTHSLLVFSRKQIVNLNPININEIVKGVKKMLSRIIGEDIELTTFLSEENLTVMADYSQIEQVLMNLVTNARDAMPQGGGLTIGTTRSIMDELFIKMHGYGNCGTYALISVSDTGSGMDKETMEKIFEPFFTTKELGRGTGLGLSIVYGIVKQHNGYINCYSEKGLGTTFKIYLPLIKSEAVEEKTVIPLPPGKGVETILLAEDDEPTRQFMKSALEEFGYTIIEAVDGEDAISKFTEAKDRIRLLILDVIMPKKSGGEAYAEIKNIKSDCKAIFVSGYTADMLKRKGLSGEDVTFILKPVALTHLLTKVRQILDR